MLISFLSHTSRRSLSLPSRVYPNYITSDYADLFIFFPVLCMHALALSPLPGRHDPCVSVIVQPQHS